MKVEDTYDMHICGECDKWAHTYDLELCQGEYHIRLCKKCLLKLLKAIIER